MQKLISRIFCLLLCVLLVVPVFAASEQSPLQDELQAFMDRNGLDASNFSMSYYNLVTEESYAFNASAFVSVGKLRFLPLHMYYYEEETKGAFAPKTDPNTGLEVPYTIQGMTLEDCRYRSIILSEDAVAEKMEADIGTPMQYLELINQRYGMLDPKSLPTEYWTGKVLNAEFLMNCIRTVSSRPELFVGLMPNYRMVQKHDAFADGSVDYSVVQIRDEAEGYVTAVAEVTAQQNFLLVASVKTISGGDKVLGQLNKVICDYIDSIVGEEVGEETVPTTRQNTPNYYIGEERMATDNTRNHWLIIAFAVAAALALIGGVVFFIWRSKHDHH